MDSSSVAVMKYTPGIIFSIRSFIRIVLYVLSMTNSIEDNSFPRKSWTFNWTSFPIVGHAENFKEASVIIQMTQPDVILLDIEMPGKSGIDLLTEIRLMHSTAKVIMFTNNANPYSKNLCLQLGADYFLDKSNEFEQIPVLLKQWAC